MSQYFYTGVKNLRKGGSSGHCRRCNGYFILEFLLSTTCSVSSGAMKQSVFSFITLHCSRNNRVTLYHIKHRIAMPWPIERTTQSLNVSSPVWLTMPAIAATDVVLDWRSAYLHTSIPRFPPPFIYLKLLWLHRVTLGNSRWSVKTNWRLTLDW